MHRLLARQLRRLGVRPGENPPVAALLAEVDRTYQEADDDRRLLERSLELTSNELLERNRQLQADLAMRLDAEARLRASEQRLTSHLAHTPLAVIEVDPALRVTDWNPSAERIFGPTRAQVVGRPLRDVLPALLDHEGRGASALLADVLASGVPARAELRGDGDAAGLVAEWSCTPLFAPDGAPAGVAALVLDTSERAAADEALRVSEERYALALRGANDGLWDWDINARRLYVSPRWRLMLGIEDATALHRPEEWLELVHPDDRAGLRDAVIAHLNGATPHLEHEYRALRGDGQWRWLLVRGLTVRDAEGRTTRMAGSQTDISDRKVAEARLIHDALHDALTGLPNRVLLLDHLQRMVTRSRRHRQQLSAVLFIDLDRFKLVNDSLGHARGDELLRVIAARMLAAVRAEDVLARMGGDEFVLLAEGLSDLTDVLDIARRLQEAIGAPLRLGDSELFVAASIGVAVCDDRARSAEDLLRDADIALYRAKAEGRNRCAVFDQAMHARVVTQLRTESELRRGVERGELRAHYQPIVDVATRAVIGFEALVRWQHPVGGLIGPASFVPLAEETELILDLGAWILHESAQRLGAWRRRYNADWTMSVNVAVRQLRHPGLVGQVRAALTAADLAPEALRLELTETALVDAPEAFETLAQLRELGVGLSLDDFGTGFSSLRALHQLPIDTLKIDRSFVAAMGPEGRPSEIVRAVVGLAHTLGKRVVAEGVEFEDQLAFLREIGCQEAQGFLFDQPRDAPTIERQLDALSAASPAP